METDSNKKSISSIIDCLIYGVLTNSTSNSKCEIQLWGDKDFPKLFTQSLDFNYMLSYSDGNLIDWLWMKFDWPKSQ